MKKLVLMMALVLGISAMVHDCCQVKNNEKCNCETENTQNTENKTKTKTKKAVKKVKEVEKKVEEKVEAKTDKTEVKN